MGRKCSYTGCGNRQGLNVDVRFHTVPSKPEERRKKWLTACSLSPGDPCRFVYICSAHFVGGAGPTRDNPDPLPCDPLTPGTQTAMDVLLSLGTIASPSHLPAAVKTSGSSGVSEKEDCMFEKQADVMRDIQMVENFLMPSGNQTAQHEEAWSAFQRLVSGLQSTDHHVLFTPREAKPVRRSLMSVLQTSCNADDSGGECVESLPMMPWTPEPHSLEVHSQDTTTSQNVSGNTTTCETRDIGIQCTRALISYEHCKHSKEEDFHFFTGITQANFEVLYLFLGGNEICSRLKYKYADGTPAKNITSTLSPRDRLFITLIRLRRGVALQDLAYVFGISLASASAITYTWFRFISLRCRRIQTHMFVTAEQQDANPNPLFDKFPNLRVIIDSTEFKIQHPFHFQLQSNTYSQYKSTNTVKYLIGISRSGAISFVSKGFEGSISDKQIVIQSGLLEQLHENDAVMADRGFDIEAELNDLNVDLYIPSFLGKRDYLQAREELKSKSVSSVRIFVEIAMSRIKNFKLLRYVIPNKLLPVLDDIVFCAAFVSNFDEQYVPSV